MTDDAFLMTELNCKLMTTISYLLKQTMEARTVEADYLLSDLRLFLMIFRFCCEDALVLGRQLAVVVVGCSCSCFVLKLQQKIQQPHL
jgi:hypothetical protein